MIWVTSQPDEIRFIWETMVQEKNFIEHGVDLDTVYCLFGIKNTPSIHLRHLMQTSKMHILAYPDNASRTYAPAIQPHLLKQFYKEYRPSYVFHMDSDVIMRNLPPFAGMMDGDWHISDASNYLDYSYLNQFPDFISGINELLHITPDWLVKHQLKAGGAGGPNYFMCGIDETFWEEVEEMGTLIHRRFFDGNKGTPNTPKNKKGDNIQIWTAGMWAWLWCAWKRNIITTINPELNFCMSDHPNKDYTMNFFHNTGGDCNVYELFNKGTYNNTYPFDSPKQAGAVFAQNHYLKYINQIIWELDNDIGFNKRYSNQLHTLTNWWVIEGEREPTEEERQFLRNVKNYKEPVHWNDFTIRRKLYGHDHSHL